MSLAEVPKKINPVKSPRTLGAWQAGKVKMYERELFIAALVIVVAFFSFGLGRLSKIYEHKEPVRIEEISGGGEASAAGLPNVQRGEQAAGLLVGSKTSDKYHFPWCAGAERIKEENKVWFSSREEAEARGYVPAGNCQGL